jgi:hypothetical protein
MLDIPVEIKAAFDAGEFAICRFMAAGLVS